MACVNTIVFPTEQITVTYLPGMSDPADGIFCYDITVAATAPHDLSHFVLGINEGATNCLGTLDVERCLVNDVEVVCEILDPDRTTQVSGVKVDFEVLKGQTIEFCVEFTTMGFGLDSVDFGVKAGGGPTGSSMSGLCGPLCGGK